MTAKTGVIYLQKDKFQFYSPYLKQVVELRFTPEMVRDLDVLNDELLEQQIKAFVTAGKIPASNLIIVLSDNAYFVKDFALQAPPPAQPPKPGQPLVPAPKMSLDDLKPQIDLFIEHVPYENVVSKTFPLKNGLRVCAVNQDLYKTVQRAFEKLGFKVFSVLPGMVLGGGMSAKPVMDGALANAAIQRAGSLKQYDLLSLEAFSPMKKEAEQVDEVQDSLQKEPPKTDKKRMIVMLGVLGVLLVILVVVFIQSQQPPPPPTATQQPALANQPTVMPPIATTTVIQPTEAINIAQTQNLKVQIVSTADASSSAQTLRTALNALKFNSIAMQTQNNAGSATTIVSFSSKANQTVRNVVLEEVRKVKADVKVQELQSGPNDITIVVGK